MSEFVNPDKAGGGALTVAASDAHGYAVISGDDLAGRPPDLAEAVKAAGVDPNTPFSGRPRPWERGDAAWFRAHPQAAHRVREQHPGELFEWGSWSAPHDFVVVRQIRPGLRVRAPFALVEAAADALAMLAALAGLVGADDEAAAHALFDLAQASGLPIPTAELAESLARNATASGMN